MDGSHLHLGWRKLTESPMSPWKTALRSWQSAYDFRQWDTSWFEIRVGSRTGSLPLNPLRLLKPAVVEDVTTFVNEVIQRPKRFICELGLSALAQIKRKHILSWKRYCQVGRESTSSHQSRQGSMALWLYVTLELIIYVFLEVKAIDQPQGLG